MLLSKLSCVCIPCFKSVVPKVCLTKVLFVAIFWSNMNTKIGVVIYMYLKHSPDYIYSKYKWVHGSNSLGSSVFADIPFLAFVTLHRERKRCSQVKLSPCYSQSQVVCVYIPSLKSAAPRVFLAKITFFFFWLGFFSLPW